MKRCLFTALALALCCMLGAAFGCDSNGGGGGGNDAAATGAKYTAADAAGKWRVSEVDEKGDPHAGTITFAADLTGASLVMQAYNEVSGMSGTLALSADGKLTGTLVSSKLAGSDYEINIFTLKLQFSAAGKLSGTMYFTYQRKDANTGQVTMVHNNVPKTWVLTR